MIQQGSQMAGRSRDRPPPRHRSRSRCAKSRSIEQPQLAFGPGGDRNEVHSGEPLVNTSIACRHPRRFRASASFNDEETMRKSRKLTATILYD